MKTILFIIAEFPPYNCAGVYRPLRFMNACVEKGYRVVVITFEHNENLVWPKEKLDEKTIHLVNKDVIIHRVPLTNISLLERNKFWKFVNTYFFVTDKFARAWKNHLFNELPIIIKQYQPCQIVTSIPPFSIANLVKKISAKFQIPFILDQRDAWSQLCISPNGTYFHYLKKLHLEKTVFESASAILSVTPQLIEVLKRTQPSIDKKKFYNIFNSFKVNDFNYHSMIEFLPSPQYEKINIGYVGTFYFDKQAWDKKNTPWYKKKLTHNLHYFPIKEDWLYRTPYYFLKTIQNLIERDKTFEKKIVFHYVGSDGATVNALVKELQLNISIVNHGYCTQQEVNSLQSSFDLLLATSEKVIDNDHYCLPSKLFSYIQSNKPIIGFVTNGIQKEFIEKSGAGLTFNPDNINESANKLEQLFKEGFRSSLNKEYLNLFSNQSTNAQFIQILENSIQKNSQISN